MQGDYRGDPICIDVIHPDISTVNGSKSELVKPVFCDKCYVGHGINGLIPLGGIRCDGCNNHHYCNRVCLMADLERHKVACGYLKHCRLREFRRIRNETFSKRIRVIDKRSRENQSQETGKRNSKKHHKWRFWSSKQKSTTRKKRKKNKKRSNVSIDWSQPQYEKHRG